MKAISVLCLALACGASTAQEWPPGCERIKDAKKLEACRVKLQGDRLREQVRRALRDPYSAVFKGEALYRSEDPAAFALCGTINSKNAYGGYVGEAPFISTTTGMVRFQISEPSGFLALWEMFCSRPA
jgi:hypothetical protein